MADEKLDYKDDDDVDRGKESEKVTPVKGFNNPSKYIDFTPTIDYCNTQVRQKMSEWLEKRS